MSDRHMIRHWRDTPCKGQKTSLSKKISTKYFGKGGENMREGEPLRLLLRLCGSIILYGEVFKSESKYDLSIRETLGEVDESQFMHRKG